MNSLAYSALVRLWTDGTVKIQIYISISCDCEHLNCLRGLFWLFSRHTKISACFTAVYFVYNFIGNTSQLFSYVSLEQMYHSATARRPAPLRAPLIQYLCVTDLKRCLPNQEDEFPTAK